MRVKAKAGDYLEVVFLDHCKHEGGDGKPIKTRVSGLIRRRDRVALEFYSWGIESDDAKLVSDNEATLTVLVSTVLAWRPLRPGRWEGKP